MIPDDIHDIMPVGDAFRESTLEMSDSTFRSIAAAGSQAEHIIVSVFMIVFVVLAVICLKNVIRLMPLLLQCLTRKNACFTMEHSVQNSSDRNFIAFVLLLPFCLIADRFDFYRPVFLSEVPHGWMALVLLGTALLYVLLRFLMASLVRKPYHINFDNWRAVRRTYLTYFIHTVFIVSATIGVMNIFGASADTVRRTAYWEMGVVYMLSFLRCAQILRENCSGMGTFLYLCALELIPTAALIVPAVYF